MDRDYTARDFATYRGIDPAYIAPLNISALVWAISTNAHQCIVKSVLSGVGYAIKNSGEADVLKVYEAVGRSAKASAANHRTRSGNVSQRFVDYFCDIFPHIPGKNDISAARMILDKCNGNVSKNHDRYAVKIDKVRKMDPKVADQVEKVVNERYHLFTVDTKNRIYDIWTYDKAAATHDFMETRGLDDNANSGFLDMMKKMGYREENFSRYLEHIRKTGQ